MNKKLATLFAIAAAVALHTSPAAAQSPAKPKAKAPKTAAKTAKRTPPAPVRYRFVVAPAGNEARYKVREQLVGIDLPSDAVGVTSGVTGWIVVDSDGRVARDSSKFIVDLRGLKSDKDRRDNFIRRRTMVTDSFPTVELVPTELKGISGKPPASGSRTFELLGDLTIRGITRPTTWTVTAKFEGGDVTGTAATAFTFNDFGLTQPRVPAVLSVADTIRLEYDFRLAPNGPAKP